MSTGPRVQSLIYSAPGFRVWTCALLAGLCAFTLACGNELPSKLEQREGQPTRITVPDEISGLHADEVDRRLSGLIGGAGLTEDGGGFAAPGVEPTPSPASPSIDDILSALGTDETRLGQLVFTVGPAESRQFAVPRLRVTTQPAHGEVTVISPNRILFIPGPSFEGSDVIGYEILDGDESVFSGLIELLAPLTDTP